MSSLSFKVLFTISDYRENRGARRNYQLCTITATTGRGMQVLQS